jgi:hypothetical protein
LLYDRGMRALLTILALLVTTTSLGGAARAQGLTPQLTLADDAGEPRYHDGGMDTGGRLALSGAIVFSSIYLSTVGAQTVADGLCGLGEHACDTNAHWRLQIPIIGGFVNAAHEPRQDLGSQLGIASSVVQLAGVGMLISGLAVHHWHVPARPTQATIVPYVSPLGTVGLSGRF